MMEKFEKIYQRAAERKGGEQGLADLVSMPRANQEIKIIPDDRILSAMTKKIFQSGFVWSVVEKKWPNFEEVFWEFNLEKLLMMPDDMLERKASDPAIIRNYRKVLTIRNNAQMLKNVSDEFGSVGQWLAEWPEEDTLGLWTYLKKNGDRLGGNTGPYSLRVLGKDTFIVSRDVEAYFRANKLIEGGVSSKKSLTVIQNAFNDWRAETNLSLQELSQILAFSTVDNHV